MVNSPPPLLKSPKFINGWIQAAVVMSSMALGYEGVRERTATDKAGV